MSDKIEYLDEFDHRPVPGPIPDVMSMPFWSLAMSIAWIAWRDPHRVARASDEWRRWQGLPPIPSFQRLCDNCEFGMFNIPADHEPIESVETLVDQTVDAGRALYSALGCGELKSYDAREKGIDNKPIEAASWAGLKSLFKLGELNDRLSDIFQNVTIQRHAVQEIWPDPTSPNEYLGDSTASEDGISDATPLLNSERSQSENTAPSCFREALEKARLSLAKNDQFGELILNAFVIMDIEYWPNATNADIFKMVCDNIGGTVHSKPSRDTFDRLISKWGLAMYSKDTRNQEGRGLEADSEGK